MRPELTVGRARRIKCDEQKPECVRCRNSKRRCGGYDGSALAAVRRASEPAVRIIRAKADDDNDESTGRPMPAVGRSSSAAGLDVAPSLLPADGAPEEARLLEWFCSRSLPDLWDRYQSGHGEESRWKEVVRTCCHEIPPIRHAALAIASMHGSIAAEGPSGARAAVPSSLALQHYNRAMSQLSFIIDGHDGESTHVALILCLLFVAIELLQNNSGKAILHLRGGLQILDWRQDRPDGAGSPDDLNLHRLLSRLRTKVASFHGFGPSIPMQPEPGRSDAFAAMARFANITEANDVLHAILSGIYVFFEHVTPAIDRIPDAAAPLPAAAVPVHRVHTTVLNRWIGMFGAFKSQHSLILSSQDLVCALLLDSLAVTTSIKLRAYLHPSSEIRYDANLATFTSLLPPLEAVVRAQAAPQRPFQLMTAIPTIQPLFFISAKCRDPTVRRSAVALLRASRVRHGMWDGPEMAVVAQRLIAIEEEGKDIATAQDVTEGMRAHGVRVEVHEGLGPKKEAVVHFWRLKKGGRKEWEKREEVVTL
jgi:hypothetical protein